MALSNTNFDGILSALIPAWLSSNYSSLFVHHNPVFMKMLMSGKIQTGGFGTKMVEPVMFPTTTGAQVERVSDPLADVSTNTTLAATAAEWLAAMYRYDWYVAERDLAKFGSNTEKVKWTENHMKAAVEKVMNFLEADMWAAPENTSSAGTEQQIASLKTLFNAGTTAATDGGALPPALASQSIAPLVDTTGSTAVTTVGNIPRAAAGAAYWCTPLLSPTSSEALNVQILSKTYSEGVAGQEHPTLIVVHRNLFDVLENLASLGGSNGGQIQRDSALADIGFDALRFRGADIVTDDYAPTAGFVSGTATARNYRIYAMNLNHLELRMREKKPDWRRVDDPRPIKRFVGTIMLGFVSDNLGRAGHAVHGNITAP